MKRFVDIMERNEGNVRLFSSYRFNADKLLALGDVIRTIQ